MEKQAKTHRIKLPELLAPAGGPAQFIAAVENGADAVYLGGKAFNARIGADNFDDKTLEEAVDYGHLRGVKTYVTMNTLLTDEELPAALRYAAFLWQIGVDALIVQDLGFGECIRQSLPDLPLHLSTQATVYNARGVEAAGALGYSRVVLARELSLTEIRAAARPALAATFAPTSACPLAGAAPVSAPPLAQTSTLVPAAWPEIEVFVHGALCICYSGQCQLSRFIGGRSGNRGCCAQPCRLPYRYAKDEQTRHHLSPRDLCLIEELDALAEAGVSSLKIEGRMKSPEYVAIVTGLYRKYLDRYARDGSYTVSEEDWLALRQIYNRGGFTKGYFDRDPAKQLMCSGLPKHQGVRVGEVKRCEKIKGGRQAACLVDVRLDPQALPLCLGDGVEIHGKRLTGNVVTYLQDRAGGIQRIGDIKEEVRPGDAVYRLRAKAQQEQAAQTFAHLTFTEGKYVRKRPVRAILHIAVDEPSALEILSPLHFTVTEAKATAQRPQNRPTTTEEMQKQLAKTGGTPFALQELSIKQTEPVSIPLSGLNALRRKALEELARQLRLASKRTPLPAREDAQAGACGEKAGAYREKIVDTPKKRSLQFYFYRVEDLLRFDFAGQSRLWQKRLWPDSEAAPCVTGLQVVALASARDFLERETELRAIETAQGIRICPYLAAVTKGQEEWIEANLPKLSSKLVSEDRPIDVENLAWIKPLAEQGVTVLGGPGLNVCNQYAKAAYGRLGLTDSLPSLEYAKGIYGRLPLMVTEHMLPAGQMIDRKGLALTVLPQSERHKTYILGEQPVPVTGVCMPAVGGADEGMHDQVPRLVRVYV